jgi:hypothetical protein
VAGIYFKQTILAYYSAQRVTITNNPANALNAPQTALLVMNMNVSNELLVILFKEAVQASLAVSQSTLVSYKQTNVWIFQVLTHWLKACVIALHQV